MRRLLLGYAERELELSARPTRIESTFEVERDRSHCEGDWMSAKSSSRIRPLHSMTAPDKTSNDGASVQYLACAMFNLHKRPPAPSNGAETRKCAIQTMWQTVNETEKLF